MQPVDAITFRVLLALQSFNLIKLWSRLNT